MLLTLLTIALAGCNNSAPEEMVLSNEKTAVIHRVFVNSAGDYTVFYRKNRELVPEKISFNFLPNGSDISIFDDVPADEPMRVVHKHYQTRYNHDRDPLMRPDRVMVEIHIHSPSDLGGGEESYRSGKHDYKHPNRVVE